MARQPLKPFVSPSSAQAESERPLPPSLWLVDTGPAPGAGAGPAHGSEVVARRASKVCEKPRASCPFPRVTSTCSFLSSRHYPKQSFTMVADTPENLRLKQQSELQSQVRGGLVPGPAGREGCRGGRAVVTPAFGKGSFPLGLLSKAQLLKSWHFLGLPAPNPEPSYFIFPDLIKGGESMPPFFPKLGWRGLTLSALGNFTWGPRSSSPLTPPPPLKGGTHLSRLMLV